ncbi:hypothetical protein Patl1_13038 [Pistacia atlantica]|uniref:Uncharacterized protein n=1 Tax=Pistacia atlantica TaxID=434234 RepID=A0ACC1AYH4_9ROSI|nr:hypothetical protein Patl1_13038 [Pistacia atlantica]
MLGKAAKIVKGRRLHGFILNLVFTIITLVIYIGDFFYVHKETSNCWIVCDDCSLPSEYVVVMACTILYYRCKKNHGEEVELPWSKGYSKVPTLPFLNENEPHDQGELCDVRLINLILMMLCCDL